MHPSEPAMSAEELRQLALAVIAADPFPQLASIDGDQPRVRPVSPVRSDGFTIYVASMRSSGKTGELDRNPKVELCYLTKDHDQVRITGIAAYVSDPDVRALIWDANPLLRAYLTSVDNPEFMLYRISPVRIRFMREWALQYYDVDLSASPTAPEPSRG